MAGIKGHFFREGVFMEETKVVLMLSGGRDSFLAGCKLLEDQENNYKLLMVTFDNGCSIQSKNAKHVADRIIAKYGKDRAEFLGVYQISAVIREFFDPYFNMKPEDQVRKFAGLTPSQFHCLICRTSMYLYSIWLAKLHNASHIAEGGREDQGFVIELPGMAKERFPKLVEAAGLHLLLPVYNLKDNRTRDFELLLRDYNCKSYEPKCLIGYPLDDSVDDSVIEGVHHYFDNVIMPRIEERGFLDIETVKGVLINKNKQYNELVP